MFCVVEMERENRASSSKIRRSERKNMGNPPCRYGEEFNQEGLNETRRNIQGLQSQMENSKEQENRHEISDEFEGFPDELWKQCWLTA